MGYILFCLWSFRWNIWSSYIYHNYDILRLKYIILWLGIYLSHLYFFIFSSLFLPCFEVGIFIIPFPHSISLVAIHFFLTFPLLLIIYKMYPWLVKIQLDTFTHFTDNEGVFEHFNSIFFSSQHDIVILYFNLTYLLNFIRHYHYCFIELIIIKLSPNLLLYSSFLSILPRFLSRIICLLPK